MQNAGIGRQRIVGRLGAEDNASMLSGFRASLAASARQARWPRSESCFVRAGDPSFFHASTFSSRFMSQPGFSRAKSALVTTRSGRANSNSLDRNAHHPVPIRLRISLIGMIPPCPGCTIRWPGKAARRAWLASMSVAEPPGRSMRPSPLPNRVSPVNSRLPIRKHVLPLCGRCYRISMSNPPISSDPFASDRSENLDGTRRASTSPNMTR